MSPAGGLTRHVGSLNGLAPNLWSNDPELAPKGRLAEEESDQALVKLYLNPVIVAGLASSMCIPQP